MLFQVTLDLALGKQEWPEFDAIRHGSNGLGPEVSCTVPEATKDTTPMPEPCGGGATTRKSGSRTALS